MLVIFILTYYLRCILHIPCKTITGIVDQAPTCLLITNTLCLHWVNMVNLSQNPATHVRNNLCLSMIMDKTICGTLWLGCKPETLCIIHANKNAKS